jgi:L-rhamnose mutarotase
MAELAELPVNIRWEAEMGPMMEVAHDYSGASDDRMAIIFRL